MVIDFHFGTGNIRRLGCRVDPLSEYTISNFFIDGMQGEFIEKIEVEFDCSDMRTTWKSTRLKSFNISA